MKKFDIKPYVHLVQARHIYMAGKLYGAEILKINDAYLKSRVCTALTNVACLSLQAGLPTKASAPHTVMTALTNLLGLKNHTGIDVAQLKGGAVATTTTTAPVVVAEAKADPKAGAKGGDKKAEKKKPEPEPERKFYLFNYF
jgi:large subunit ribosomal protein LP0